MLVSFIQIKISDVDIVNHEKPIVNHFYISVNNRLIQIFYTLEVSHAYLRLRINLDDHLGCLYHIGSVIHAAFLYVPVSLDF